MTNSNQTIYCVRHVNSGKIFFGTTAQCGDFYGTYDSQNYRLNVSSKSGKTWQAEFYKMNIGWRSSHIEVDGETEDLAMETLQEGHLFDCLTSHDSFITSLADNEIVGLLELSDLKSIVFDARLHELKNLDDDELFDWACNAAHTAEVQWLALQKFAKYPFNGLNEGLIAQIKANIGYAPSEKQPVLRALPY